MADEDDVSKLEEKIAQKTRELEILKSALREKVSHWFVNGVTTSDIFAFFLIPFIFDNIF